MVIVCVMINLIFLVIMKKCIVLSWIVLVLVGVFCFYKMDMRESEGGSIIFWLVWSDDLEEYLFYSMLEECGKVLILYLFFLILLGMISVIIGFLF